MQGNRYGRGWMPARGYGRDFGGRHGPMQGHGHGPGSNRPCDAGFRGGYDRGWTEEMAYGREPGMPNGSGAFTPFAWDPMMRWSGWNPLMGFVPYQDTPHQWSYGLADDARRYEHDYFRGSTAHPHGGGYGRAYGPGEHRVPPRQSPLYGRGGDRAVREWAAEHGYRVDHTIQPRLGPRR